MNPDDFDWTKCIFCQKVSRGAKTTCPAKSKRNDVGCGYNYLAKTIESFMQCDLLPATVKLRLLDEGDGVEATCARHYACWHKTCFRQSLHSTKIKFLKVVRNLYIAIVKKAALADVNVSKLILFAQHSATVMVSVIEISVQQLSVVYHQNNVCICCYRPRFACSHVADIQRR
jgi:hypothetical protein